MKVYIAEVIFYYEGSQVLGVFTTKERAYEEGHKRRLRQYNEGGPTYTYGDELEVTEWEVEE